MIVVVDLNKRKAEVLEVKEKPRGVITFGSEILLEAVLNNHDANFWEYPVYIGRGPFANYHFMGANRATAVFISPLTGGVFASSAGGVARALSAAGIDGIIITGHAPKPHALYVQGDEKGSIDVLLFEFDGLEELFKEGGAFEVIRFLEDELSDRFSGYYRTMAVGPGGYATNFGTVVSTENSMGTFDFFGRGGLGTVLAHKNLVGMIVGGSHPDPEIDEKIFEKMKEIDTFKPTEKYRLVVKEGVGGTIYNWFTLKAMLPALNWNTIFMNDREREEIYEDYIRPLTEEIRRRFRGGKIKSKTCGEKCVAVCKKMDDGKKVEYEPFTSLGLQTGIFDYEKILDLTNRVDALGLDAIETGNAISLFIDAVDQGIYDGNASLVNIDPERNYQFALEFLDRLLRGDYPLSDGVAQGARSMGLKELAVYVPTPRGGIVPPQYWNPGFHLNFPLVGKFMTYYHNDNLSGKEWGEKAGQRFMKELLLEDLGICRFHRGWIEKLLEMVGVKTDYLEETVRRLKLINIVRKGYILPPEGRSVHLIKTYFRLFGKDVDPWAFYFEAKEGIDRYVPTLELPEEALSSTPP